MFGIPILFLVFNRLDTTKQVFEKIKEIRPKYLYVAADGARENKEGESEKCENIRKYILDNIDWKCEIKTLFREKNLGCRVAVSSAIDWFFDDVEKGIILEDDVLPDISFFRFCSEMLDRYYQNDKVFQIGGCNHNILELTEQSYFFSKYPSIWGWATWKSKWQKYRETESEIANDKLDTWKNQFEKIFGHPKEVELRIQQIENIFNNTIDTWDYIWAATMYLNQGLCLLPSQNLIQNIGFGDDATHTKNKQEVYEVGSYSPPIKHPQLVSAFQVYDQNYYKRPMEVTTKASIIKRIYHKLAPSIIKKVYRKLYSYYESYMNNNRVFFQILRHYKGMYILQKPVVMNQNANDVCNSKCTMCNIWKQEDDSHISPKEYKQILNNSLFSSVKHVGITGGEPTLRDDIEDMFIATVENLPNIKGVSIITNAIETEEVKEKLININSSVKKRETNFHVMVSLDGVGKVHDINRGTKGNFDSATEVIEHILKNDIDFSTGTTITKKNIYKMEEMLFFLKSKNIYGRFRVAEFIERLYNNDIENNIRVFNEDEIYYLTLFFYKLIYTYEKNELYKRTYYNIIHMLNGGERQILCPYQVNGVVLNAKGELAYCAPKSKIIGNALKESADKLYRNNIKHRKEIFKKHCPSCIHDYHALPTLSAYKTKKAKEKWNSIMTIANFDNIEKNCRQYIKNEYKRNEKIDAKTVFITGWYGTETLGDKAILAHIFDFYNEKYQSKVNFIVSSLFPLITDRTLIELKQKAEVVDTSTPDFIKRAAESDIIVMGGGPLMDLDELRLPLWAFKVGKIYNKHNVVFGCGLGPLKNHEGTVTKILDMADEIWVRDNASKLYAEKLSERKDIVVYEDPAKKYINKVAQNIKVTKKPILSCFLREWEPSYKGDLSDNEFLEVKERFNENISYFIKRIAKEWDLEIKCYPMHVFAIGNDDRDYFRDIKQKYFKEYKFDFEEGVNSIEGAIELMKSSSLVITMRFHSVLFANTLKANFFPIDYTNGGKIKGYLEDNGYEDKLYDVKLFASMTHEEIDDIVKTINLKSSK